ncbi:hypothetical protein ACFVT8_19350 [Lysinibacillus sp. NPDC058147]|uniref:hypothetical protein n=1 Tax=unclassified Lysinibacillus TaxID=2636778 RepID=UPI0036DE27B4
MKERIATTTEEPDEATDREKKSTERRAGVTESPPSERRMERKNQLKKELQVTLA